MNKEGIILMDFIIHYNCMFLRILPEFQTRLKEHSIESRIK